MEKKLSSSDLLKIPTERQKKTDAAQECQKEPSASDILEVLTKLLKKSDGVQNHLMQHVKPIYSCLEGIEKASKEEAVAAKETAANTKELLEISNDIKTLLEALLEKFPEKVQNQQKRTRSSSENISNDIRDSPQELSPLSPPRKVPRSVLRRPPPKVKCLGCNNNHQFEHCNVYPDCVSRRKILKEKGLCTYCTGTINSCTSSIQDCQYKYRKCQNCRQIHMNALCPTMYPPMSKKKPAGDA